MSGGEGTDSLCLHIEELHIYPCLDGKWVSHFQISQLWNCFMCILVWAKWIVDGGPFSMLGREFIGKEKRKVILG